MNQPLLEISKTSDGRWIIDGSLRIVGRFEKENNTYVFGEGEEIKKHSNFFDDHFAVQIEEDKNGFLPDVKDVGGRLEKIRKKLVKSNPDMHFYASGSICIAGPIDVILYKKSKKSFTDFMRELVQPFFYDQLHHENFETWPRGEYLHGVWGSIQNFGRLDEDNQKEVFEDLLKVIKISKDPAVMEILEHKKNVKGHTPCLCGSKKILRKCHPELFKGLWTLRKLQKK